MNYIYGGNTVREKVIIAKKRLFEPLFCMYLIDETINNILIKMAYCKKYNKKILIKCAE